MNPVGLFMAFIIRNSAVKARMNPTMPFAAIGPAGSVSRPMAPGAALCAIPGQPVCASAGPAVPGGRAPGLASSTKTDGPVKPSPSDRDDRANGQET